jgi:hypothetical protein
MFTLLRNTHDKFEQMSGKKILVLFTLIFIICLPLGIAIGNIINSRLKENEMLLNQVSSQPKEVSTYYDGKIEYVNPGFYPNDNISYTLVDGSGKQLILLRAKDQKLVIAEGLFVKVKGAISKTKDGKSDVLNVSEVIIKNASN